MRKALAKIGKYCLFLIPGALGFIGLHVLAQPPELLGDALYHSLNMYLLDYGGDAPNALVEIARWTAPLCTASGVVLAVVAARDWLLNYARYRRGRAVAVYGPAEEKADMLAQLGREGVDGKERFIRANRYILLQEESQVFAFYNRYRRDFGGADVYVKCSAIPAQAASAPHLHLFCPEETAARTFWKRRDLYALSRTREHHMQIVLLGFGKLGEEVLTYALQGNVFAPDQRIEYHIFGDGARFRAIHTQLEEISDPVVFHGEPWYERLTLLEQADLVLVLTQEGQLELLRDLLLATSRPQIDVFAADGETPGLLDGRERLTLYAWKEEGHRLENIFGDALLARAKQINMRYETEYNGVPDNEKNREEAWQRLDTFTRYSNISAADYHDVRLAMLAAIGVRPDPETLPPEVLELLAELEHIRWSRYHRLYNWRWGVPENGAAKDRARRIHADLVPYRELPPSEKEKNRETVKMMLSLDWQA